jgi:CHAD domain-containing protein
MSFQLESGKSLRKEIARLAGKQIDKALEQLTGAADGSPDEAIHEARKCFKKVRALLRLVRPSIGEATFQKENAWFRDAGRPLTEVRDAKILVETLDKLCEHFAGRVRRQSFREIRKELVANQKATRKRVLEEQQALATVEALIQEARERLDDWTDVPNKWSALGDGLEQVYRQARKAFAAADADPTVENLHEWRKQAKYLRYQLEILRPLWPEVMEELACQADHLGELLGDDHDLAVLRQLLTDDPDRFGDPATREVLLALIDQRRAELQQEAKLLGQRLLQDRPKDCVRRLKGYWKTWRTASEQGLPNEPQAGHA